MAMIDTIHWPDRAVADVDPVVLAELIKLAVTLRAKSPSEAASPQILQTRKEFLRESLGPAEDADLAYERIIGGDELQSINYLERGMIAARAVARVNLGRDGFGTGFLIAPRVLITNNHVLPDVARAERAYAEFRYEVDLADNELAPCRFRFAPGELFATSKELDFTVVAVADDPGASQGIGLAHFGCLPLIETTGKISEGEWLTVIQHPAGKRKSICVRENQFIKRDDDVIWYTTDTEPGSSGSPVFNNDWYVVALHHAGVPEKRDGVVQTNRDGSTKWIGNEGIRVSRIVQSLKSSHPRHALLLPLFAATPTTARITTAGPSVAVTVARSREVIMTENHNASFPLDVRLRIHADGRIEPLASGSRATESTADAALAVLEKAKTRVASYDAPFDTNYNKRKGYDPDFLGAANSVALPLIELEHLQAIAAPMIKTLGESPDDYVLKYNNFSVVMHKDRRLPIYSAANVSFGGRFVLSRTPDVWRRDPRILAEHQLENWYYASNNFDRGHMTRREDLEYGEKPVDALASAADTCHWTNCVPQHSRFNQNKEIWQGIERYVLEQSIVKGNVNAQVITGPVLDDGDPEYRKVQYPLQFWKIVAALDGDKKLFATAYIATQEEVIAQYGIEVTEAPFGAYKTFQTKISEVERLTGLTFSFGGKDSTAVDPLAKLPSSRRRRARSLESIGPNAPNDYYEIADLDDIVI